jgi:phenylpropionate dioxygenase-like ring-hydroxylating dioxygenase large terminal subunit
MAIQVRETTADAETAGVFPQCWYPVALSSEVDRGQVVGKELLGGKVICYRGANGNATVLSAYCRHLGTDLTHGEVVGDNIRCGFHYWEYGQDGRCAHIPVSDRIPDDSSLFDFPTAESLGLVWAFNGEEPTYDVPTFPNIDVTTLEVRTGEIGPMPFPHWLATANSMDMQHLEVVHGVPNDVDLDTIDVGPNHIEYDMVWHDPNFGRIAQHIKDFGSNVVMIMGTMAGMELSQFFAGRPTTEDESFGYITVAVPKAEVQGVDTDAVQQQLDMAEGYARGLIADDQRILQGVRFRVDTLVPADRALSKWLRYLDEIPRANPAAELIT